MYHALALVLTGLLLVPALNLYLPPASPFYLQDFWISVIGKYLCFAMLALALDLIWGYAGILSLGHGAFFGLGGYMIGMWLMYERTKDIVLSSFEGRALPPTPEEISDAIGTQIFGVVGALKSPLYGISRTACLPSYCSWLWFPGCLRWSLAGSPSGVALPVFIFRS